MIISHRHRFIFFHNPITGSDALRRYLDAWSDEPVVDFRARMPDQPFHHYMNPEEAEYTFRIQGWNFNSYARITCVRNPYTRLPALYDRIRKIDPVWRLKSTLGLSLPRFENWLSDTSPNGTGGRGTPTQVWRRYGAWSAADWCADRITHVIPIEKVARLMPPILRELDIPRPEDPEILSAPKSSPRALTPQAANLIGSRYATDISAFGYAPFDISAAA
jgi:hypothetical protein